MLADEHGLNVNSIYCYRGPANVHFPYEMEDANLTLRDYHVDHQTVIHACYETPFAEVEAAQLSQAMGSLTLEEEAGHEDEVLSNLEVVTLSPQQFFFCLGSSR